MKQYKFTQRIPAVCSGIRPKQYDFNRFEELIETELFQKFLDARFEIFEEHGVPAGVLMHRGGYSPIMFGTITSNAITAPINKQTAPAQNNPFETPISGREIDLIKNIMNRPHIDISDVDMEQQANIIGEGAVSDNRTPEQMLGLL